MKNVNQSSCNIECCVEKALNVIGGKWAFLIIKNLFDGTKRFGELKKCLHNVSARTLTNYLRSLEKNQILIREVYPTVPVPVTYTLTEKGHDLNNIIDAMYVWGEKWA